MTNDSLFPPPRLYAAGVLLVGSKMSRGGRRIKKCIQPSKQAFGRRHPSGTHFERCPKGLLAHSFWGASAEQLDIGAGKAKHSICRKCGARRNLSVRQKKNKRTAAVHENCLNCNELFIFIAELCWKKEGRMLCCYITFCSYFLVLWSTNLGTEI